MSDERPEKPLPEEPLAEKTSLEKAPAPGAPASASASAPAPEPAALRASDADRERVVDRLRDAVAEGRLDMEEFEERLEAAYTSRTYAELEPLTRDLPAVSPVAGEFPAAAGQPGSGSWAGRIGGSGTSATGVAVMGAFQRRGRWTVPRRFNAFALMGGGEIDLREANFAEREVVISCVAVMGGIQITVPPGVDVEVRGIGIMGGFDQRRSGDHAAEPGAPRVVVTGLAFWGGVEIKVKPLKGKSLGGGTPRKEL
ncbi:DUF1707 domain-containing protein [Streptomyces sp. NBC_00249]|uniref:DUF1707 SHOCT-like domain-containing protein n=1 Tax=Streptomyces sp. NBC_00249 TaxID=2975690 RepID=UPI00224CEF39|nr:DUF1707 domain-containing protein [Streptomyces sp. NBC_00249]MCX5198401.1 DUF1707 domain-containing protein [Streptomyces sp. NBC_00249]